MASMAGAGLEFGSEISTRWEPAMVRAGPCAVNSISKPPDGAAYSTAGSHWPWLASKRRGVWASVAWACATAASRGAAASVRALHRTTAKRKFPSVAEVDIEKRFTPMRRRLGLRHYQDETIAITAIERALGRARARRKLAACITGHVNGSVQAHHQGQTGVAGAAAEIGRPFQPGKARHARLQLGNKDVGTLLPCRLGRIHGGRKIRRYGVPGDVQEAGVIRRDIVADVAIGSAQIAGVQQERRITGVNHQDKSIAVATVGRLEGVLRNREIIRKGRIR